MLNLREQFLNKNKKKKKRVRSGFLLLEVKMILRRPTLADKETVLEMMAEFEQTHQPTMVGFGTPTILFMKSG